MNRLPTARYPEYVKALGWGEMIAHEIRSIGDKAPISEIVGNAIFNFCCSHLEEQARNDRGDLINGNPCNACGSPSALTLIKQANESDDV